MFPAKLESVTLQNGNILDAGHYLRWGNWSVHFGSEAPIAYYVPCTYGECSRAANVDIKMLECVNDVVGTVPCDMRLQRLGAPGYEDRFYCRIWLDKIHMPDGEYFDLEIKCPASVKLQ